MFYAVYAVATGELVSMGRGAAPVVDAAFGVREYAQEPDRERKVWDTAATDFVPRPPVQRAVLTTDEFWDRLTGAELVAIEAASRPNTQAACQVAVAVKSLERAEVLDVTLPRIRAALQVLVNQGLLTMARLNAITTPAVDP